MRFGILVGACAFAGLVSGCSEPIDGGCRRDEDCLLGDTPGFCQPDGHCSVPDPTCPSGLSYPVSAGGGVGGTCVPGDPADGGSPPSEDGSASAAVATGDDTSTEGGASLGSSEGSSGESSEEATSSDATGGDATDTAASETTESGTTAEPTGSSTGTTDDG